MRLDDGKRRLIVALIRRLFFEGLRQHLPADLQQALDTSYQTLIAQGTLPACP